MVLGSAATGTLCVEWLGPKTDAVRLAVSASDSAGDPIAMLIDSRKHARLTLEMIPDGSAHVRVFSPDGIRILSAPRRRMHRVRRPCLAGTPERSRRG